VNQYKPFCAKMNTTNSGLAKQYTFQLFIVWQNVPALHLVAAGGTVGM